MESTTTTKEEIQATKQNLEKVFSSARIHTATTYPENESAMYNLISFKSKVFQLLDAIPLNKLDKVDKKD